MSILPQGWQTIRLGELVEVNPPKDRMEADATTPVAFVSMASVAEEFGGIDATGSRPFADVKKGYVQFRERDVLFAKITPCMENGKIGVVPKLDSEVGYGSTEFHVLRVPAGVAPHWVAYYLSQRDFRRAARRSMAGSAGQLRVPEAWLSEQSIPVAPVSEQKRVVAKLEEIIPDLDTGVAALERARTNLRRYRATVLKAAVEGRLTERWRAAHPDVEPGEKLLDRILKDRRRRWEEAQLRRFAEKTQAPPKGWKDRYPQPVSPNAAEFGDLPETWTWSSIGQCFAVAVGATPSRREPKYWNGDVRWVSSGEVKFARISDTREKITREGLDNSSTQINPKGSVLLGMIGEGKTRGQAAILDIPAANNQNCAAIWVAETPVLPEFVYYWLWSQYEITRRAGSGNNQPALNKTLVEQIPLPLPPLAEQSEIVVETERHLTICEAVERQLKIESSRASGLRQAILKWAFEGTLVPQDGREEPASELMARIQAARVSGSGAAGRGSRGRIRKAIRESGSR